MNATHTASQSYKTQDVKLPKTWDERTDRDRYLRVYFAKLNVVVFVLSEMTF